MKTRQTTYVGAFLWTTGMILMVLSLPAYARPLLASLMAVGGFISLIVGLVLLYRPEEKLHQYFKLLKR